ncbi:MAG: hypothetical protein F4Y26_09460, partial [Gammaproteobacteria bacterium]|nr:hypothetical protein [Gammaproteobacteria bacterium]
RARTHPSPALGPAGEGVADADRDAILKLLRDRATRLDDEIVPRVKAAMRSTADMPAHEVAFVRKMGGAYAGMRSRAIGKVSDSAPRLGLSDAEITARYAYTTSDSTWGYRPINRALRSEDGTKKADFADYRDTLNAALAKLPDHVGTVKRRTRLTAEELARYRNSKGEVIVEQAFTSTSHGGRAAFSGPHEFVIESAHGKLVQPWSAYPGEREVLFAAGSRFKVLEVESLGGGRYKIRLREVE